MEKPPRRNKALERLPRQPLAGPTLFGGADSTCDAASEKPVRFLAALDDKATDIRHLFSLKRAVWLGFFFLVGMGLLAAGYAALQRDAAHVKTLPLVAQQRVVVAAKGAPASDNTSPQAAVIENIQDDEAAHSPFSALRPVKDSASTVTRESAQAQTPEPKVGAPTRREKQVAQPSETTPKQSVAQKQAPVKKVKDADVVLLEALVSHVDAQQRSVAEKPAVQGTVGATEVASPVRVAVANDDAAKRCAGLSALEGELCRMKVCAGRGEGEAACQAAYDALTAR